MTATDAASAHPEAQAQPSLAFDLLNEKTRRWIWRQGWTELREIQEHAIPLLLSGARDLIIAAGTASGKTEAAFLPIVSRLSANERVPGAGFEAVYIGPLRALINDQFERIEALCEEVGIAVTKWHGDVAATVKQRARRHPSGILLTTPESLEAMLCRRGHEVARLFAALRYFVVDEMHAFIDTERGRQLQSLLHRLEIVAGHRVARVGLSATLADVQSSAEFLRPLDPGNVAVLKSAAGGSELRLQIRGYIERHFRGVLPRNECDESQQYDPALKRIVRHLFDTLRGHRGLIFADSKRTVELATGELRGLCEAQRVPEEFFAHHGSLSRELREEAERRLKDNTRPGSIVATITLELGIDVGHIEAVAQIGPGHTVSGLRQRVGRSGRRPGQPSVMRIYITEWELSARIHPLDALRPDTVQAIAMVYLMLRHWNEPPIAGRLHLSTLVHQILALIAQHGGLTARQGWTKLVESGVFRGVDQTLYLAVLRRMADPEVQLIEQAPDGTLMAGAEGERIIADRGFYAVFATADEFRVVTDAGKNLGQVSARTPPLPHDVIILGGRRWRVLEVSGRRREILVTAAFGGKPPNFDGPPPPPGEGVVAEMRRVYLDSAVPRFLDETATQLLAEARETFARLGLLDHSLCRHEDELLLFPWVGNRAQSALILALHLHGIPAGPHGIAVNVPARHERALLDALVQLARAAPPDPVELARLIPSPLKQRAKYDGYLGDDLLSRCYASEHIDSAPIPSIAADLLARMPPK